MQVESCEFSLLEYEYAFKHQKNQILENKRIDNPLGLVPKKRNFDQKFHEDGIDDSSSFQNEDIDLDLGVETQWRFGKGSTDLLHQRLVIEERQ